MSLLHVENLSVSFDGFKALDIKNFSLDENELRVVIGPNGAGKTTFMDVLCGKTKSDTGKALLKNHDLTKMSEKDIVDIGIGRKFQAPSIFSSLTVWENLMLSLKTDKSVFHSLFFKTSKAQKEKIISVAKKTGLEDYLQKEAGSMSHGQKQWLEIAMVILQDPQILLIDEPAAGMTDEETERTGDLLKELAKDHAIIVIEHDMTFVRQIARKVTVLHEGRLLLEGPMEEVQNDPKVIECYLGSSH
jgi:urea transport system ATP-binding protein